MTDHVYVRVAGYGLVIVPFAPFVISRTDSQSDAVDIEHFRSSGDWFARIIPCNGGYISKVDQHTHSIFDLLSIDCGPNDQRWQLETSVFTCDWPIGYSVHSNNFPADPSPFDLVGPNRELIFVQASDTVPELTQLRTPNQRVLATGQDSEYQWMDLGYDLKGQYWRQRHTLVLRCQSMMLVTVQVRESFADQAIAIAHQVAESLKWRA